jgi:MscS family membrane protein
MNFSERFLNYSILDNRVENVLLFVGLLLVAWLFKRYISVLLGKVLYRFFRRYSREDRFTAFKHKILPPLQWFLVLMIVMFGVGLLRFPAAWNITFMNYRVYAVLTGLLQTAIAFAFTWLILRIVDFLALVAKERASATESKLDDQLVPFVKDAVKIVIMVFALLFVLGSILKFNIASLIAGVGIGGLAIALAAQESLKNLFASITIFLDKPFHVGDVVTAGNVTGTVENIGFRSTRLRTADKSFVTLPNKVMVDEAVDNQTMRSERRVNILIVLGFDTTLDQIRNIVSELETYFKEHLETKHTITSCASTTSRQMAFD